MTDQAQSARRAATLASFAHWHRSNSDRFLKNGLPQAPAYVLPPQLVPMSAHGAVSYLWSNREDAPGTALENARRASWCALNHPRPTDEFPELIPKNGGVPLGVWCPCLPYTGDSLSSSSQALITEHDTISQFNPDSLVTETTTTLKVANASDAIWKKMAEGSDPANWRLQAPDYFKQSEPTKETTQSPTGLGWKGTLHEVFEWDWNPDYSASYENILNIDFYGDKELVADCTTVTVDYSLRQCISTDLLLVSQSGGLDIDAGSLVLQRKDASVTVTAKKRIRYTQPQLAPDGFAFLMAYLTPSVLALWLDQSVTQGVTFAIQPANSAGAAKDLTPTTPAVTELSEDLNGARVSPSPKTRPKTRPTTRPATRPKMTKRPQATPTK
jgi:hypothetical protein